MARIKHYGILFFLAFMIWATGPIEPSLEAYLNPWYILLGICILLLVYLIWFICEKLFNFLDRRFGFTSDKFRSLIPFYILAFGCSVVIFTIGFISIFAIPIPQETDIEFTIAGDSVFITSFVLSTYIVVSKFRFLGKTRKAIQSSIAEKVFSFRGTRVNYRIPSGEIAYLYLNESIVYLIKKDETRIAISESISEVKNYSSEDFFFLANRKYLLTREAVKSWTRSQTRKIIVELDPPLNLEVSVSKNRAAEFLDWISNKTMSPSQAFTSASIKN